MKNKKKKNYQGYFIVITASLIAVMSLAFIVNYFVNHYSYQNKVAYVNTSTVIQNFKGTAQFIKNHRKKKEFAGINFVNKKNEKELHELIYNNEIEPYLKEFGYNNGFQIILTNNNINNIAYSKPIVDITQEVIDSINLNYMAEK